MRKDILEEKETVKRGPESKVDKKQRIVYLFDEINPETALDLIKELIEMDQDKKRRPITLFISTPGGYCDYGFAIIDTIENMKCKVRGIALGDVCSMGPAVYVACHERYIMPHAQIMLHPMSLGAADYLKFAKSRIQNGETVDKMYNEYFLSKTKMPKKIFDKSRANEVWLSAEEALKYGIAHKIL